MNDSRGAKGTSKGDAQTPLLATPYAEAVEKVAAALGVDVDHGLSSEGAAARATAAGRNVIDVASVRFAWSILLDQLRSAVVLLLVGAVIAGLAIGEFVEAAAIGVVLLVNTVVGFVTEHRAVRSMEALRALASPRSDVERDGRRDEIESAELVPGDVVSVEAGDRVPADLRLLETNEFAVDESALTGESDLVHKQTDPVNPSASLPERSCMAFMGTVAGSGRARGIVVATGMATEAGRIAALTLATPRSEAPLQVGLERLARMLSVGVFALAAVLAALGWVRGLGQREILEVSIALAVAIVPEGLPAVATLTLTVGMRRMATEHALVRRLPVVETLGSTTVIASDKTGTLTTNRITVVEVAVARGWTEDALWETAALCNDADVAPDGDPVGDPTEVALLDAAQAFGMDWRGLKGVRPRRGELPFSPETKRMVVVVGDTVHVKGAPEVLMRFDPDLRLGSRADEMARRGLRTLALARNSLSEDCVSDVRSDGRLAARCADGLLAGLEVIGVVGMRDPVRPEAVTAVTACHAAGISVLMVTGDQAGTAARVGIELGLKAVSPLTGAEIERLNEDDLAQRLAQTDICARVTPEQKLRVVRALQSTGEVVAVTGDGVNDAPALRQADVGVAMGIAGTDVAREAADIILTDDDFATIEQAVKEGRRVFISIRRFAQFLFSWHLSVVFLVTTALVLGLSAPLAGLMILWNNLIIDVIPSFALALEPGAEDAMRRPPRPKGESVVGKETLRRIVAQGGLVGGVGLIVFLLATQAWSLPIDEAQTAAFVTLTAAQLMAVFNARTESGSGFARATRSPWLWGALGITLILEALALGLVPLRDLLGLSSIDLKLWPVLLALAAVPLLLTQMKRILWPH